MPRISKFYGIAIYMYFHDHAPPHFHAIYGRDRAVIAIESVELLEGRLPARAISLVREWGRRNRAELLDNWDLARAGRALRRIAPLD